MRPVVVYFSRTGNTKRFAKALADGVHASMIDLSGSLPTTVESYDPLILGTPVEGASPAKETVAFIEGMNRHEGAKVVLFCTCRLFGNERALKVMEKALSVKGYTTILKVSKRGVKPEKEADFSKQVAEVKKALSL